MKEKLCFPGGQWEGDSWEVQFNVHMQENEPFELCPHAIRLERIDPRFNVRTSSDGRDLTWKIQWIIPRIAVAYNEGGHCSTGICIDCIADALPKILKIYTPELTSED